MFLFLKKKKKKPPGGKVQALFWKLRIVEILPNRKSIFKTDFPVCIPLRDSVLWLPSGPCHSSCHYLDTVPCYRLSAGPGELCGKGKYFCLCQNTTGEWVGEEDSFASFIMVLLD